MSQLYVSKVTQMIARNGLSVRFAAGIPRPLHPSLVDVAKSRGVREHAGTTPQEQESQVQPDPSTEQDEVIADVVAAIRALQESGQAKAFSERTGEPNLNALRKQAGFQVTDAQRDAAWAIVLSED